MTNCFVHANQGPTGFINAHQLVGCWLNEETFVIASRWFDINVVFSAHSLKTPGIVLLTKLVFGWADC